MLELHRSVSRDVAAPPQRCVEVLAAVERYPSWYDLLSSAERIAADRVRLTAHVLGLDATMECALEVGGRSVVLRRIPYDSEDKERYVADWTLTPAAAGSHATLDLTAALAVPGPAALLRRKVEHRLADDLMEAFARCVASSR